MSMKKYSDDELKKDFLGAAISKELGYNQEAWESPEIPLKMSEYSKIGNASPKTIGRRFGSENSKDGWNNLKKELGLPIEVSKYKPKEHIENIKENSDNGVAPRKRNINDPGRTSYERNGGNLFKSYFGAVWLSGNEPQGSWFNDSFNHAEEFEHINRSFFIENYWHGDLELENKPYETRIDNSSDYIIPNLKEFVEKCELSSKKVLRDELFPNLRQSNTSGLISRFEQDRFIELVGSYESGWKTNFNAWEDFLQRAEEELDFNERQVKTLLNPNADPEDGGSFGRWMSQENLPDGAITFIDGSDERQDYEVSSQ